MSGDRVSPVDIEAIRSRQPSWNVISLSPEERDALCDEVESKRAALAAMTEQLKQAKDALEVVRRSTYGSTAMLPSVAISLNGVARHALDALGVTHGTERSIQQQIVLILDGKTKRTVNDYSLAYEIYQSVRYDIYNDLVATVTRNLFSEMTHGD